MLYLLGLAQSFSRLPVNLLKKLKNQLNMNMQNSDHPPFNTCKTNPASNCYMSPDRCKAILALGFKDKALVACQLTWARFFPYLGILFLFLIASLCCNAIITSLCEISITFSVLFIPLDIVQLLFSLGIMATILRYMDGAEPHIRAQTLLEPFKRWLALLPISAMYICLTIPENLRQLSAFQNTAYYSVMIFSTVSWFFLVYFYFFMADCRTASTRQILQVPFYLLVRQPRIWFQAVLTCIILYGGLFLLALLMCGVISLVAPNMDLVACYIYQDFATANLAGALLVLVFILIMLILLVILSIYTMFLFAIAYRQSIIACGGYQTQKGQEA